MSDLDIHSAVFDFDGEGFQVDAGGGAFCLARAVVEAAHARGASVKVIFETAFLNDELIVKACELTEAAGADYVKTSTGFASEGATLHNVQLMKATVGDRLKVKSSGGVRTLDQLIDYSTRTG